MIPKDLDQEENVNWYLEQGGICAYMGITTVFGETW